jgi:glyoxylase I family protein
MRHLAFEVNDIQKTRDYLVLQNITAEAIRVDEFTQKSFFFVADPDNLPVEFYEK